jgi:hypothetical protein
MPFATAKNRIEIFTGPDLHETAIPMKNRQIWANVGYGRPYTVASCMASTNLIRQATLRHNGPRLLRGTSANCFQLRWPTVRLAHQETVHDLGGPSDS